MSGDTVITMVGNLTADPDDGPPTAHRRPPPSTTRTTRGRSPTLVSPTSHRSNPEPSSVAGPARSVPPPPPTLSVPTLDCRYPMERSTCGHPDASRPSVAPWRHPRSTGRGPRQADHPAPTGGRTRPRRGAVRRPPRPGALSAGAQREHRTQLARPRPIGPGNAHSLRRVNGPGTRGHLQHRAADLTPICAMKVRHRHHTSAGFCTYDHPATFVPMPAGAQLGPPLHQLHPATLEHTSDSGRY